MDDWKSEQIQKEHYREFVEALFDEAEEYD
jgi:hypothetical protein